MARGGQEISELLHEGMAGWSCSCPLGDAAGIVSSAVEGGASLISSIVDVAGQGRADTAARRAQSREARAALEDLAARTRARGVAAPPPWGLIAVGGVLALAVVGAAYALTKPAAPAEASP